MGTNQARLPGYTEGSVNRGSGLSRRDYIALLVSNQTKIVNAQAIGGPSGAAVTTYTSITRAGNRLNFPSTLVAAITPGVSGTVKLRVRGFDQFGERVDEITPTVTLTTATTNYIYLSKVFAFVEGVQFQSNGLDSLAQTISLGTRWDWTRTIDASNNHIAGENLGWGFPLWVRYRPIGYAFGTNNRQRRNRSGLYPQPVAASRTGTFTGNPANNETVTVDGIVYTFKTALTPAANEVLIGASASEDASNLADAIMASPGTVGVKYGGGTVAHSTCRASAAAGVITITARQPGSLGNTIVLAEALTNFTWAGTNLTGGISDLCEVLGINVLEISATAANSVITNLGLSDVEVGRAAAGWTASLEKIGLLFQSSVPGWAVADTYLVEMAMRSLDGAFA